MKYYLVYKDLTPYGWSFDLNIVKAFLKQRNDSYKWMKSNKREVEIIFNADRSLNERMINCIKLKSTKYERKFLLFITIDELRNCEKMIQQLMIDQCRLNKGNISYERLTECISIISDLKDRYYNALYFIGYRPPEILSLYNQNYTYYDINDLIDIAYDECGWLSCPLYNSITKYGVPSIYNLDEVYEKVIYSLESFIKVLKDELRSSK